MEQEQTIEEKAAEYIVKRGRGRPKGSKNKRYQITKNGFEEAPKKE